MDTFTSCRRRFSAFVTVKNGVYETIYCYTDEERIAAIEKLGPNPEDYSI